MTEFDSCKKQKSDFCCLINKNKALRFQVSLVLSEMTDKDVTKMYADNSELGPLSLLPASVSVT